MLPEAHLSLFSSSLSVILVISVSTISTTAIAAWLVHKDACRAIDKASPESVAPVVLALGALLSSLRPVLPWFGPRTLATPTRDESSSAQMPHNGLSAEDPTGERP